MWLVVACSLGLFFVSCGGSKPYRYYTLSSLQEETTTSVEGFVVGLSNIELPQYLRRSQIITYSSANQVAVAPYDRWAEPLDDNFARAMKENLLVLVDGVGYVTYPWVGVTHAEIAIVMNVTRFDMDQDNTVWLVAEWALKDPETDEIVYVEISRKKHVLGSEEKKLNYDELVALMSTLVEDLSRDIAEAIETRIALN